MAQKTQTQKKTQMTLKERIKKEIEIYEETSLRYFPSFAPTQKDVIELIDHYWVSKYRDGDTDEYGYKMPFYNRVETPTLTASKMIDLDTKDVIIEAEEGQSYYPAWFFGKEVNIWMKENDFATFLNNAVLQWPKYGHIIAKKSGDRVELVPIQNIINDPAAPSILASPFLIEKHEYYPEQLREIGRKNGWQKIELAIEFCKSPITIYERHGYIEGENDNYFILAIPDDENLNNAIVLYQDTIDRSELYKELKWDDIPERALGRGQVEKLFEAQIAINQNEYLLRKGLRWTSKHVFQTTDETAAKNLMTDVDDGELLLTQSLVSPVPMEERNLHVYREDDSKWDTNIDRRTFSYDVVRGERAPAGTPLGSSILQTKMAGGYFDFKREQLGIFIKEILEDWVIPSFKNKKRDLHEIMLGEFDDEELERITHLIIGNRYNKKLIEHIAKTGEIPTMDERELMKSLIAEEVKSSKSIEVPKGFYDNLKYKIRVVITSEQIDTASKLTTLQTMMQILGSNPTVLQDKNIRRVFFEMLNLVGVSPVQFEETQNTPAQIGGSIARTVPPKVPAVISANKTV